eukprot:1210045-Pleurochrysis_carterae.AAC.1
MNISSGVTFGFGIFAEVIIPIRPLDGHATSVDATRSPPPWHAFLASSPGQMGMTFYLRAYSKHIVQVPAFIIVCGGAAPVLASLPYLQTTVEL